MNNTNETLCAKCDHLFFVRLKVEWNNGGNGKTSGSCLLMPEFFSQEIKDNNVVRDMNGLPIILKCGKFRKKRKK